MDIYVQVLIDILFILLCVKFLNTAIKNFSGIFNKKDTVYVISKSSFQKIYIIADIAFIVIAFVLFYFIVKNLIIPMHLNKNPYKSVLSTPFYLFSNTIRVATLLTIGISSISEIFVKERIDKKGVVLKGGLIVWENIMSFRKTDKNIILLDVANNSKFLSHKTYNKRIVCQECERDIIFDYIEKYTKL